MSFMEEVIERLGQDALAVSDEEILTPKGSIQCTATGKVVLRRSQGPREPLGRMRDVESIISTYKALEA